MVWKWTVGTVGGGGVNRLCPPASKKSAAADICTLDIGSVKHGTHPAPPPEGRIPFVSDRRSDRPCFWLGCTAEPPVARSQTSCRLGGRLSARLLCSPRVAQLLLTSVKGGLLTPPTVAQEHASRPSLFLGGDAWDTRVKTSVFIAVDGCT